MNRCSKTSRNINSQSFQVAVLLSGEVDMETRNSQDCFLKQISKSTSRRLIFQNILNSEKLSHVYHARKQFSDLNDDLFRNNHKQKLLFFVIADVRDCRLALFD